MRYAVAVVMEVGEQGPDAAWEEVTQRLTGKQHADAETGAYFIGDPRVIDTQDEYSTESVVPALMRRSAEEEEGWVDVSGLSNDEAARLTAALSKPDPRVAALAQIRSVATEPVHGMTLTETLTWAKAKLERVANIAEAGEPDEDWPAAKEVFDALDDPRRDEDNQAALDAAVAKEETFTVIGTYEDAEGEDERPQRFAEVYASTTGWEGAEAAAQEEHPTLAIAGVVAGSVKLLDAC